MSNLPLASAWRVSCAVMSRSLSATSVLIFALCLTGCDRNIEPYEPGEDEAPASPEGDPPGGAQTAAGA